MPHREKGKRKKRPHVSTGEGVRFRGRIWIDGPEETLLGYGRIVLLERVKQYGSISKAAKSMGISYRHAWTLIESMNRQVTHPLVVKSAGGPNGGGATVTEHGEKALHLFWDTYNRFEDFLREQEEHIRQTLTEEEL